MEREEETKRLRLPKKTEEAEKKRLATGFKERKHEHIHKEIEEREREEAQAIINEFGKRIEKKGKKPIIEGFTGECDRAGFDGVSKARTVRAGQETEKKRQKLIKIMDHFEREKREEAAPLIEAAFQHRLADEQLSMNVSNRGGKFGGEI